MKPKTEAPEKAQQPAITKYIQPQRSGIQPYSLSRNAVGYIVKGKKYIYYGDRRYEINKGDVFYLKAGNHYIEDIPGEDKSFEQITFFYSSDELRSILTTLSQTYNMTINNDHDCKDHHDHPHVICPAWPTIRNFFHTVNLYLREDLFSDQSIAEKLKTTELIYLLFSQTDCYIKNQIFKDINNAPENFEQIIRQNIFTDNNLEDLARLCNKSLTSFKKDFKNHFGAPPHRWLTHKRLTHARLLLVSTGKPITEIGSECGFLNTSHFINKFKTEYGYTPAAYRKRLRSKQPKERDKLPMTSNNNS